MVIGFPSRAAQQPNGAVARWMETARLIRKLGRTIELETMIQPLETADGTSRRRYVHDDRGLGDALCKSRGRSRQRPARSIGMKSCAVSQRSVCRAMKFGRSSASKEKNTTADKKAEGCGDCWTWTALDSDTKLIMSGRLRKSLTCWTRRKVNDKAMADGNWRRPNSADQSVVHPSTPWDQSSRLANTISAIPNKYHHINTHAAAVNVAKVVVASGGRIYLLDIDTGVGSQISN